MKQYYFLLTAFLCCLPLLSHAVEEQGEKQLKVEETILALGADEEADRNAASQAIFDNIDQYKQALAEAAKSTDPEVQKRAKVLLFIGEQGVSVRSSPSILALAKSALQAGDAEREKRLEDLSVAVLQEDYDQLCKQKPKETLWFEDPLAAHKFAVSLGKPLFLIGLPEKLSPEDERFVSMLKGEKFFQLIGKECICLMISFDDKNRASKSNAQWFKISELEDYVVPFRCLFRKYYRKSCVSVGEILDREKEDEASLHKRFLDFKALDAKVLKR